MAKRRKKLNKKILIPLLIVILLIVLGFSFIINKNNQKEITSISEEKETTTENQEDVTEEEIAEETEEDEKEKEEETTEEQELTKEETTSPENTETKKEETKEVKKETTTNNSNNETFTTSKGYSGYTKDGITYIDGILIANKTYSLPESYAPGLSSNVTNKANEMFAAAKKEKGYNLKIQSGFRSYATQKRLYNNYVSSRGKSAADTFSARPGHSEHQSGLAFDVCENSGKYKDACINSNFDSTEEAKWLSDNSYKYGFILRYPSGKTNETGYKYESWHFRYVGVELATKLYNNGDWITLEDYYGITSEYSD